MNINAELAWKRVKKDLNGKHFIAPLFLTKILDHNYEKWIKYLNERFSAQAHFPHPMEIIEVPKGKGLIRPGSLINVEDNIMYTALVQECYPLILKQISWSQNVVDFAYILSDENLENADWFKQQLIGWNNFREKSIEKVSTGYQYVIVTDLTGFYDNIDIQTLIFDLKSIGVDPEITAELSRYLNKWTQINGRGLPQSNSASDVLAKLYLDNVDQGLRNAGFSHLRYVDDIRIFCKNLVEAKKALIELTRLLRKRGLNIQSAKTKILNSRQAMDEIEGLQPLIGVVQEKFREEIISFEFSSAYFDSEDGEEFVDNSETPLEVIRETFKTYFVDGSDEDFDKTLLHYLLNRLISESDSYALDYCLANFERHPEETSYFLKYSKSLDTFDIEVLDLMDNMKNSLIAFLQSDAAIYDYQNYQILVWFNDNIPTQSEQLLSICRSYAFDNNKPYYLRSISRLILGRFGNFADLEKLEDHLNYINSDLERAELLCSLVKMEKGRRNSLLSRFSKDGLLTEFAIPFIKAQH
ncbi:Reverse transcriptase (RNA-dependent DNA polymerase) [Pedobacter sp. ok626]|uniref:RNA-directed DNA polymerase n=1 Tax=Pedobacter sp. ok626 TaxID=1761882 RepID=UPI000885CB1D|nr:RNA-directed DNA polymerase [Pedobacter sp. ok626]SDL72339.1 Reverse transcriptase (RNA-dependent DNA polymerase) [Pedobacter sp. ok626]